MKLYTLSYGKSKKRMHPIMTDSWEKCINYKKARQNCKGWHLIEEAEAEATVWKQKSATIGGNKPTTVARVGHGLAGYIGKNGFNPHT